MPAHSDIDIRMKENYEHPYRIKLTRRMPVIIRIDGKAFHTFTRGFEKPFDNVLIKTMQDTMKYLCENIMGCKIGYTQSDEISLLITDYDTFTTQPWFDYNIQKICSISASMATLEFNRKFKENVDKYNSDIASLSNLQDPKLNVSNPIMPKYLSAIRKGAMFDSRCFNIPREEVTNYFYSRQIDASRNSIEMFGRAYFSDKELHKKNTSMIQDMVHEKYGLNWNDLPTTKKRGSCCIKETVTGTVVNVKDGTDETVTRNKWVIDDEIPIFSGDDREYIEKYVNIDMK